MPYEGVAAARQEERAVTREKEIQFFSHLNKKT
jgi:hypothetical protein